jgi:hypothetical protein
MKFKVGDILIPYEVIIDDSGNKLDMSTWCDYRHKYEVISMDNNVFRYTPLDHYQLKGRTNGRSPFFLPISLCERNYTLEINDPECGSCRSTCKKGKRCGLYEERV